MCGINNLIRETCVLIKTHSICQFIQDKSIVYIAHNVNRDKAAISVNNCYPLLFSALKSHFNVLKVLRPIMWIIVFRRKYIDGLVHGRRTSGALKHLSYVFLQDHRCHVWPHCIYIQNNQNGKLHVQVVRNITFVASIFANIVERRGIW